MKNNYMKFNGGKFKSSFLIGSLATCLMIFTSIEGKAEDATATTIAAGALSSSLTDNDLRNCGVLLGQSKKKLLNEFLESLKSKASGGDVKIMKDYADILHNRFTCIEVEVTGNSSWVQYDQDQDGKITSESPQKIIPSIRTNIVAFNALNEVLVAYAAISDKDVGARIALGDYYLKYREVLGNIAEGYKLISGAHYILCIYEEGDKFNCNLLEYKLQSYKEIIGTEKCERLDELAEVWANKYLDDVAQAQEGDSEKIETVEDEDVNDGELVVTAKLKGKDFELTASAMSGELIGYQNQYQNISIQMDNGNILSEYRNSVTGEKLRIEDAGFAPGDVFKLKNLLPGVPREQLIVEGSEWFPRGEGTTENYTIYRVDDNGITELLSLLTKRDFDGIEDSNRPAVYFSATVEEKIENKKLTIVYKYTINKGKHHKLNFEWDGRKFTEKTGKYKEVRELYEN
jgi:hypothetical protein